MPAIKVPATVLVTGANGFIGAWVCKALLDAGYTVRGTVRSSGKGEYLVNLFKSYEGKFTYVIVQDIAEDGAFDEAVKGVDAVVHTASPCTFAGDDPQAWIQPAVRGTLSVLKSIEKHAPGVQRVIFTSTGATIADLSKPIGTVFTEDDWNDLSVKQVEEKGKDAGNHKYIASKVLAEKAAWAEAERQKTWDLVTVHPLMTLGPFIHQVSDPSALNSSIALFYKIVSAKEGEISQDVLVAPNVPFGDVRDVALAHVRALEVPEAGGQRFIAGIGPYTWQDALDVLPASYARGTPGAGKSVKHMVFGPAKAKRVLGMDFRSFEDIIKDTEKDLREREWLVAT